MKAKQAASRRDTIWEDGQPVPGPKFRKTIYLLPNLLTAANMVLGLLSIVYSINDALSLKLGVEGNTLPFVWPARLILIAIAMDFMDGRVARATGTTSKFGAEFDSMADLISFGVAPAILIFLSVLRYMPALGMSISMLYVVCAAVRLARFNVQAEVEEKDHFMGLPSPAAAGILVSYVLLSRWDSWYEKKIFVGKMMGWYEGNIGWVEGIGIPLLTVMVAFMMVSKIPYPSLKKWNREQIKARTLVAVFMVIYLLVYAAEITSFLILVIYLFWGLFHSATKTGVARLKARRSAH